MNKKVKEEIKKTEKLNNEKGETKMESSKVKLNIATFS